MSNIVAFPNVESKTQFPMMFVSKNDKGFKTETYNTIGDVPYKVTGYSENYTMERMHGLVVPREELDEQPQFEGFLGPMWDGDKLRYETQSVYDLFFD